MRKIMKLFTSLTGMSIFIYTIAAEIDGIGRFACILFGVIFSLIGTWMKTERS